MIDRNHSHIHNHGGAQLLEQWNFTEAGDLRILGRRQWRAESAQAQRLDFFGASFGLKLATGRDDVRNPQGLTVAPSGLLWECEHGAMGGDEVNIIVRGKNYGWPVITHGRDYDGSPIGEGAYKEGLLQPRRYWTPSIAPSGLSFYTGGLFPAWRGNLFMGALKDRMLVRMELDAAGTAITTEERLLAGAIGRIRQVRPGPDGRLHLLTDEDDGGVWTVRPVG